MSTGTVGSAEQILGTTELEYYKCCRCVFLRTVTTLIDWRCLDNTDPKDGMNIEPFFSQSDASVENVSDIESAICKRDRNGRSRCIQYLLKRKETNSYGRYNTVAPFWHTEYLNENV